MNELVLYLNTFTKMILDIKDEVKYEKQPMSVKYDKYRFCIENGIVTYVVFDKHIFGHIKNKIHCFCIFYANNLLSYELYLTTHDGIPMYTATIDYNDTNELKHVVFSLLDVLTKLPREITLFYRKNDNDELSFYSGTVIIAVNDENNSLCLSAALTGLTMIKDVYVLCEEEEKQKSMDSFFFLS